MERFTGMYSHIFQIVEPDFSQTHKIGNIGIIANYIYSHICSFLLYFDHMMLVNVKVNVSGYRRITFQGFKCHWSS